MSQEQKLHKAELRKMQAQATQESGLGAYLARSRQERKRQVEERLERLLSKRERIDIFAVIFIVAFCFTILYQLQFLQSSKLELHTIGSFALAMGVFSLMAVMSVLLLRSVGYMDIENFRKELGKTSLRHFIANDKDFGDDYEWPFFLALGLQTGFAYIYSGFYAGDIFQNLSTMSWELNYVLSVVNAGIGEELFFSLFLAGLCLTFCTRTWHIVLAGAVNVFAFLIFHTVVYGANPTAAVYICFLRLIYFLVYVKTRRVSIPMFLHMFNNFLVVQTILFV